MRTSFVYYAKEDPWQDDRDGNHGLPIILTRRNSEPGSEAIWSGIRDWWEQIPEERARQYFEAATFAGAPIQQAQAEA